MTRILSVFTYALLACGIVSAQQIKLPQGQNAHKVPHVEFTDTSYTFTIWIQARETEYAVGVRSSSCLTNRKTLDMEIACGSMDTDTVTHYLRTLDTSIVALRPGRVIPKSSGTTTLVFSDPRPPHSLADSVVVRVTEEGGKLILQCRCMD
jgi:hypothetical protein